MTRCEPSERLDETRNLLDVGVRLRQLAEVPDVKPQVANLESRGVVVFRARGVVTETG